MATQTLKGARAPSRKKTVPSPGLVPAAPAEKSDKVGIGAALRKAHDWLEALAQNAKERARKRRQESEQKLAKKLAERERRRQATIVIEQTAKRDAADAKLKAAGKRLLGHWAHTGATDFVAKGGQAVTIVESFELCVDQEALRSALPADIWQRVTRPRVDAEELLALGKDSVVVRSAVEKAIEVKKFKAAVVPANRGGGSEDEES